MTEIVNAIYDLMGRIVEPMIDDEAVREKVERLFQVIIYPFIIKNRWFTPGIWWVFTPGKLGNMSLKLKILLLIRKYI